jgi:Ni/Co efflux regulator RcnB
MVRMKGPALALALAALAVAFGASAQNYGHHDQPRSGGYGEPRWDHQGGERYGGGGGYGPGPAFGYAPRPGRGYWREYQPGPPQRFVAGPGGYVTPTFRHWGRGQILPSTSRVQPIYDFRPYHLRRPPYGYQWYRVGGDFILASIGAGLIFEVIEADR